MANFILSDLSVGTRHHTFFRRNSVEHQFDIDLVWGELPKPKGTFELSLDLQQPNDRPI